MIIISSDWRGSRIFHFNNQHQHCIWTDNFGHNERMMYIWWSMIGNTHRNCFFFSFFFSLLFWGTYRYLMHNEWTDHKKNKLQHRTKMVFRSKSIDPDDKKRSNKQTIIYYWIQRPGRLFDVHRRYWFLKREFYIKRSLIAAYKGEKNHH